MNIKWYPLALALAGAALLALPGCGKRSEPLDPSVTQEQSTDTLPAPVTASRSGWTTDYEQARQDAKANNKLVLLDFTGSDWCGWCKLLDREVFAKPQFKEYASKNLVLVELDFPRTKAMPAALRAENTRLARHYQVEGFPTIILLNGDGKVVGALGYVEGGPDAFIAQLERIRKG